MLPPQFRATIIVAAGLLAPLWWSWTVNSLTYAFYIAAGAPKAPSATFAYASVVIPSIAIGFFAGTGVAHLSSNRPITCWLMFWISVLSSTALIGLMSGGSAVASFELFHSPGNLAFLIASGVACIYTYSRRPRNDV